MIDRGSPPGKADIDSQSRASRQEAVVRDPQITAGDACLGCGGTDLRRVRRYRTNTSYGPAVFGDAWLYHCAQCGLAQAWPRPDAGALADYYESDYRSGLVYGTDVSNAVSFPKDNLFYYNRGMSIAELVAPHVRTERPEILDIGTGFGHVLHAFGERFPESRRIAIEFNDYAVDHLRALGVEVLTEPVEHALPRLERQFDVIVLSHVLEHLLEPRAVLALLYDRLAPGGVLYIEVPNIPTESLTEYPDHMWAPRCDEPHMTFFTTEALSRLLQSAGLDLISCDTAGPRYRNISALRFRMPPLRYVLQRMLPHKLFLYLRQLRITRPLRVSDREEEFYQYGGFRLWIRSVTRRPED
ncbi:MAG TPA: class I SAM-dependent methyltransferase [Longimicrobiales bacterium]|nr:class I SAM-dependent methyltransferase [Longimicrobiales bacterium]